MHPQPSIVNKQWTRVMWLTAACSLFYLILLFDILDSYEFLLFLLLLATSAALILSASAAVINSIITKKAPANSTVIITLSSLLVAVGFYLYREGAFYGHKQLEATFLDEGGRLDLALYSDGHYILETGWILGSEKFSGTYRTSGDSITFNNYPIADNNFVAQTIERRGNKIYFSRNESGVFKDTSFYYFQIKNQPL